MTGYADMDAAELRSELQICDEAVDRLLDKLMAALEADDWPWVTALLVALKAQVALKRSLRRRLKLEVAG